MNAPTVAPAPLTPKITTGTIPADMGYTQPTIQPAVIPATMTGATFQKSGREQALEQRVRELEAALFQKDKTIQELEAALDRKGSGAKGTGSKTRSPGRNGSGFRKVAESKPVIR